MSDFTGLGDLVAEIKQVTDDIKVADSSFGQRLDGCEKSINELFKKTSRPGFGGEREDASFERKEAVEFCKSRHHALTHNKAEELDYSPCGAEVDLAISAQRGKPKDREPFADHVGRARSAAAAKYSRRAGWPALVAARLSNLPRKPDA